MQTTWPARNGISQHEPKVGTRPGERAKGLGTNGVGPFLRGLHDGQGLVVLERLGDGDGHAAARDKGVSLETWSAEGRSKPDADD